MEGEIKSERLFNGVTATFPDGSRVEVEVSVTIANARCDDNDRGIKNISLMAVI